MVKLSSTEVVRDEETVTGVSQKCAYGGRGGPFHAMPVKHPLIMTPCKPELVLFRGFQAPLILPCQ